VSFDAWGKRRLINGADGDPYVGNIATQRGFTGHEMLDEVGLIHMNGRIYDPATGRMMQADPIIQNPFDPQNFNRYSYVLNNPLSFTDPSGYSAWTKFRDRVVKPIVIAVIAYYTGQWASNAFLNSAAAAADAAAVGSGEFFTASTISSAQIGGSGITYGTAASAIGGAASGFAAGGLQGGNIQSAINGAFSGGLSGGINGYFGNSYSLNRVALETVAGGVNSMIRGGSFSAGAKRAAVFSLMTYGNWAMRQEMIAQSRINTDNVNGTSAGFMGDRIKLAGARRTIFPGTDDYLPCVAPLGGCQGAPIASNDQGANSFGIRYRSGSIFDAVNESFAGPHDWFRNATGSYDKFGNSVFMTGMRDMFDSYVANFGMLIPAAPFAVAGFVQTYLPSLTYVRGTK
jgi:RHS repeat-associated protein